MSYTSKKDVSSPIHKIATGDHLACFSCFSLHTKMAMKKHFHLARFCWLLMLLYLLSNVGILLCLNMCD